MDLAPPEERFTLNREQVMLAERLDRSFDAFRGNLRLATDALELGDMGSADAAIEACERLASRSRLPHHRWPVAAFRALRATMSGRFDDAELQLGRAQAEAERAGDPNAERSLWCQRLALARAREDLAAVRQLGRRAAWRTSSRSEDCRA